MKASEILGLLLFVVALGLVSNPSIDDDMINFFLPRIALLLIGMLFIFKKDRED